MVVLSFSFSLRDFHSCRRLVGPTYPSWAHGPTPRVFASPVPAYGTDGLRFAHRRAGGGETFLLPNCCHSARWLVGPAGLTPREYRGLRAPKPRGSGLVGAAHPHAPGFTFGRPKVNRKTAKTNGFGFLCLNQSLLNSEHLCTELSFCHLICGLVVNDASAAAL